MAALVDMTGYSLTYWKHVATVYALRTGEDKASAEAFADWAENGWNDSEHVDKAFDRWVVFGKPSADPLAWVPDPRD